MSACFYQGVFAPGNLLLESNHSVINSIMIFSDYSILLMETMCFCGSNHCSSQALYLAFHFNLDHIGGKNLLGFK